MIEQTTQCDYCLRDHDGEHIATGWARITIVHNVQANEERSTKDLCPDCYRVMKTALTEQGE